MTRYLSIKLARALLTMLLVVSFAFVVLRLAGDPVRTMMPEDVSPKVIEHYRQLWGLDRPLWEQYLRYIGSALRGDFGVSFQDNRGVVSLIAERLPATLRLGIPAYLLAVVFGTTMGIVAALRRNSATDRGMMTIAVFGYAMPNFFLGIVLILIFSVWLRILPSSGDTRSSSIILPMITLATAHAAAIARFARSAMLEILNEPYMRTARAKGLSAMVRNLRHALPNALVPIVTIMGLKFGHLVAGAIVIETVFAWPGVGRLLIQSVDTRDLAVVQALVLMVAASMITANFLVDVFYGLIDPRVRTQK
ncbi:ABC transporter permease [Frigidibacter sp. ROC022]|uniref:ABC transporter permease n=1 Tax=Frigidibacter sp. ROC022 TaxID=2971796 RepID=UPI00215A7965|nr:ABC transporter permease [Frigidibacter sp. ROC022]MCR8723902.1 ABC transporter permease [Frigidibacter sp. ROC022]